MDDGIGAIILIISVIVMSLFFFVYVFEGLTAVFLIVVIVLTPILGYTSVVVIATKWDKYKVMKEWDEFEKMEKK